MGLSQGFVPRLIAVHIQAKDWLYLAALPRLDLDFWHSPMMHTACGRKKTACNLPFGICLPGPDTTAPVPEYRKLSLFGGLELRSS